MPVARTDNTFDSFDLQRNPGMREALERCRAVAAGETPFAFLWGSFGTGKTHLAIAALNVRLAQGEGCWFWKVPDFLAWIREKVFGGEGWEIDELTRSYREASTLVVFDDLGTENATDWACEQLYRVLDSRYDFRLPTIITTNQDLGRLDGRLLSRFREGLVVCEGRDVRQAPLRMGS